MRIETARQGGGGLLLPHGRDQSGHAGSSLCVLTQHNVGILICIVGPNDDAQQVQHVELAEAGQAARNQSSKFMD